MRFALAKFLRERIEQRQNFHVTRKKIVDRPKLVCGVGWRCIRDAVLDIRKWNGANYRRLEIENARDRLGIRSGTVRFVQRQQFVFRDDNRFVAKVGNVGLWRKRNERGRIDFDCAQVARDFAFDEIAQHRAGFGFNREKNLLADKRNRFVALEPSNAQARRFEGNRARRDWLLAFAVDECKQIGFCNCQQCAVARAKSIGILRKQNQIIAVPRHAGKFGVLVRGAPGKRNRDDGRFVWCLRARSRRRGRRARRQIGNAFFHRGARKENRGENEKEKDEQNDFPSMALHE